MMEIISNILLHPGLESSKMVIQTIAIMIPSRLHVCIYIYTYTSVPTGLYHSHHYCISWILGLYNHPNPVGMIPTEKTSIDDNYDHLPI